MNVSVEVSLQSKMYTYTMKPLQRGSDLTCTLDSGLCETFYISLYDS